VYRIKRGVMEEWDFVDERELQGWKGGVVCIFFPSVK